MSLNALGLGFMFTATDLASGVMKNISANLTQLEAAAGRSLGGVDKMVRDLGTGLVTTAVGIGGLGASFNLAKDAGDLEQAISKVRVVARGATKEQLAEMEAFALKVAPTLGVAPTEALDGLKMFIQTGFDLEDAMQRLPAVLKFAAAAEMDIATATGLASQAMRSFGYTTEEEFLRSLDQMMHASTRFSLKVEDLRIGLARASAGASLYGASLTETLTVYGLMKDVLDSIQVSGTAASYMFQRLANPKYHAQIQKTLGVTILDRKKGRYRNFRDVLAEMIPGLAKMTQDELNAFLVPIFGNEAVKGISAMLKRLESGYKTTTGTVLKGAAAFRAYWDEMRSQNGALDDMSDIMLSNFNGTLRRLNSTWLAFRAVMGKPFLESWQSAVERLTGAFGQLNVVLMDMPEGNKRFIADVAIGSASLLSLFGLLGIGKAAFPIFAGGAKLAGGALMRIVSVGFRFLNIFNPYRALLLTIGAGFWVAKENVGGFGDQMDKFIDSLSGAGEVFSKLGQYAVEAWDLISDSFTFVIESSGPIFTWLGKALNELAAAFGELTGAADKFTGPGSLMKAIFAGIGAIAGTLVSFITGLVGVVVKLITKIVQAVNWVIRAKNKVKGWFGDDKEQKLRPMPKPKIGIGKPQIVQQEPVQQVIQLKALEISRDTAPDKGEADDGRAASSKRSPAQAAVAEHDEPSRRHSMFEGVLPSRMTPTIDYDEMGRALARHPTYVYLDGDRLVATIDRIRARNRADASEL